MSYSRGAPYSYNDWLRDIRVELDIPPGGSEAYLRDKAKYDKIRTKKASRVKVNKKCPPGYKYRPKRKPGQRKCAKEKVRIYLSFLQKMAKRNGISIFKLRKDKKGYTRTLLTIPQLKSRLTRHGISYKMNNKFGIVPLMALSLASTIASNPMARSLAKSVATRAIGLGSNIANREYEKAKKKAKEYIGTQFGVLQPTRSISDSRNTRRDTEDALREMWNLRRNRVRERMRREIAGDIIFPDRPWHRAAPPYATTIQRYARGMIARNPPGAGAAFGVLPMGGGKGREEPEDPRIAAYAIEKKQKIAEQNRKWRAAKAAETADKYEAIREAGMDRAAADAIRYIGMTARERTTAMAKQRRELAKQAKAYMAQQGAAQALLASASGAGSSSSGAGPSSAGLDFTIPDVDFGRTRYNYNYYGTQEMWQ